MLVIFWRYHNSLQVYYWRVRNIPVKMLRGTESEYIHINKTVKEQLGVHLTQGVRLAKW